MDRDESLRQEMGRRGAEKVRTESQFDIFRDNVDVILKLVSEGA